MSYSSEVLADSPLAYYRLDEASGTTMGDSSGNSRAGTYVGPPTLGATSLLASDTADKAITVTANSGQCGSVTHATWMNLSSAFTVEAWASLSSATDGSNGDAIVSIYGSGGFCWLVWRNTTGHWAAQVFNGSGTAFNVAASASVTLNQTYHLALVFNGSTIELFVDGVSAGSTAFSGSANVGGTSPLDIGRYSSTSSTTPGGTIDDVAVYGTALSSTRIAAHHTAGINSGASVTPPAGAATAAATAPGIAAGAGMAPPAAAATAATTAPAISSAVNIAVPAAAATAAAAAPAISAAAALNPPAGAATADATAPSITAGSSSSADVSPPAGPATADATAPAISAAATIAPPAGAATADATSPAVSAAVNIAVPAAAATADATAPAITTGGPVSLDLPVLAINLDLFAPGFRSNVKLGLPCLRIKLAAPAPRFQGIKPLPTVIGVLYERDGVTRIDRLRNIDTASWRDVVSAKGQATFRVPLDDDSTAEITDRRVVKLSWLLDGQIVATFACRIRAEGSRVKALAVDGRRWVQFQNMPGSLDFLSDDVVWPPLPLEQTDAATRWFGYMSAEDDWYVPEDWGTPQGQAWVDTADTFRGKLPSDFRGIDRDAEWISTISPTTTQPEFNFNYFRGEITVDQDTDIEILYTVDNFLWFYLDSELVVNVPPPGRGQWRNGYTLNAHLTAGDHLFAARVQNSRFSLVQGANPIAFICTVRALNSDGSVNKDHPNAIDDKGVLFRTDAANWLAHGDAPEPGWHRAQVLLKLIDEGKTHSADDPTYNGLTSVRLGFDSEHDSDGNRWTDRGSYELDTGTLDLAGVAVKLTDRFMNVWMDPHDMRLHAFTRMGRDRRGEIQLRYGWDPDQAGTILDAEIDVKGVQYNSVLTQLPIIRWLQTDRDSSIASVGRVVAGINAAPLGTLGSGGFVADQLLDDGAAQLSSIAVKSSTLEGKLPYVDYDLGDTITIPGRRGIATAHRALAFNVVGPTKDQPVVQAWAEFVEDQSG